ncbi:MAG: DEAD/DEAH box helicase family protein [Atopobiaceae bacterium]|nr:DEAD/DEAH box helicase family protein [Atopobiaceae bacterium]
MQPDYFDNRARIVKDDRVAQIGTGDRLSVAASVFSMYAYRELAEQLEGLDEFRFIFTSDAFTASRPKKEKREFYIPRLSREQGLFGTQFEIKLRNELTQKAVATECADWIRRKARFKSFPESGHMDSFLEVRKRDDDIAYLPFDEFTTSKLGTERGESGFSMTMRLDASQSRECLRNFDEAWESGQLQDVTDAVIDSISTMYAENAPELVYYAALYRIFNEFLDDISEDVLPNEGTGFQQSAIWGKLYDFQRDAALAIINKLETYDGCILADSVGLGKTFTALAVIKYYESRNRNVLVLCPKKLKDNWLTYNQNVVNNPIAADRLRYDVLYHTDLSRDKGMSETGIPLDRINWGAYDLVVIDESHNFRNGADSASKNDDKENRYQRLLARVIQEGVKTKVLMLSATPVNNRFRDLRNQLALAYAV